MGKPYTFELRERVVAAVVVEKRAQAEVATLFGVGIATLERWRAGDALADKAGKPGPKGGGFDAAALERLHTQIKAAPDARLGDQVLAWQAASGQRVSEATLWRALHAAGWTRKKALGQRRTRRGGAHCLAKGARRARFHADGQRGRERQRRGHGATLRLGTPGQRAVDMASRKRGPNTTILAALTPAGHRVPEPTYIRHARSAVIRGARWAVENTRP